LQNFLRSSISKSSPSAIATKQHIIAAPLQHRDTRMALRINDARTAFYKQLNPEQKAAVMQSNVKSKYDCSTALSTLENAMAKAKNLKNLRPLLPFLDSIETLHAKIQSYDSEVILDVLWAPPVVLLKDTSEVNSYFNNIRDAMCDLGNKIDQSEVENLDIDAISNLFIQSLQLYQASFAFVWGE
jgi:hypothetical protein